MKAKRLTASPAVVQATSARRSALHGTSAPGPRDSSRTQAGGETPVILVPGYLSYPARWDTLARTLRHNGFRSIISLRYDSLRQGVPEIAELVAAECFSAARRGGSRGVHLIGYSLGGLAVRYAVQFLGADADALSAVTIATPHLGTPLAYAGLGPAARQMRTRSELLDDLPPIDSSGRVRWSLIGSISDLVVPISSATADRHADSVSISASGHLGIINAPRLAEVTTDHLQFCNAQQARSEMLAS